MLNMAGSLLFVILATGAVSGDEYQLIRSALLTMTDPSGGSGRPLDQQPLIADQTTADDRSLNELVHRAITRSMASSPREARQTWEAFRRTNEAPMAIGGVPLRQGSRFVTVRPDGAEQALRENPDRHGILLVSRPAVSPDGARAFVGLIEIERELRHAYVQEFRRDAVGSWTRVQAWGVPIEDSAH